jgi:hypothetical protein
MSLAEGRTCTICSDTIAEACDGLAHCGSCFGSSLADLTGVGLERVGKNLLWKELVGYTDNIDNTGTIYPESKRLFGNLEERVANYESQLERMTWARGFLADMGSISNSMVQLLRRVQRMMDTARRKKGNTVLREARALLADISEVGEKADALRARYDNRTGLPDDFNHSADSIFQRLGPLIQSLTTTVQRYSDIARRNLDAVENHERSASASSQRPASAQASRSSGAAAKKVCRRPAAHVGAKTAVKKLCAVRRRPAAAATGRQRERVRQVGKLKRTPAGKAPRKKPVAARKVATARRLLRHKEKHTVTRDRKVRKG